MDEYSGVKPRRHALILKLIAEQRIENQETLKAALQASGIAATQATLSRDLRELGLVKLADPDGGGLVGDESGETGADLLSEEGGGEEKGDCNETEKHIGLVSLSPAKCDSKRGLAFVVLR